MLSFFRHYQKIIFLFTTILIVISFVFFGTYKAVAPALSGHREDKVLYKTIKGRKVSQSYVEKVARFLNLEPTFSYDVKKMLDSNPLNDGVIAKDFLMQGCAALLISDQEKELLEEKLKSEKLFSPYQHPTKRELSAEATWQRFVPELVEQLSRLQGSVTALSEEALQIRSLLYLMHQKFNGEMVKQVLRYQEYQMGVQADLLLGNKDHALFGYHTLSDWFGEEFVRNAAKVIIEGAQLAKVYGLKVSKDEVYTDLYGRAQSCYTTLSQKVELPVKNGAELLRLLAGRLQMEERDVVEIWEDILYFRRLLDERGGAILVDSLALGCFGNFAHRAVQVKVTEMAKDFVFTTLDELREFELYIDGVGEKRENLLLLPSNYKAAELVAIEAPELVGRRFWVGVAQVKKEELEAKVSLTELWAWQERHYESLQEKFSLPAFALFDRIEESLRVEVDRYSYRCIIASHPEWVEEVLMTKPSVDQEFVLRFTQKKGEFAGISDIAALRARLDREDRVVAYTQDGEHYYNFTVHQRGFVGEILSFAEAKKTGSLALLRERKGGDQLLQALLGAIEADLRKKGVVIPQEDKALFCLHRRFYNYLQQVQNDPSYSEGMDLSYRPSTRYKTIGYSDEGFEEALSLKEGVARFVCGKDGGLALYEWDAFLSDKTLPLEKLYMIQQLLSKDERRIVIEGLAHEIH